VVSVHALQPGQQVRAVWADGQALARVHEVLPNLRSATAPNAAGAEPLPPSS